MCIWCSRCTLSGLGLQAAMRTPFAKVVLLHFLLYLVCSVGYLSPFLLSALTPFASASLHCVHTEIQEGVKEHFLLFVPMAGARI